MSGVARFSSLHVAHYCRVVDARLLPFLVVYLLILGTSEVGLVGARGVPGTR